MSADRKLKHLSIRLLGAIYFCERGGNEIIMTMDARFVENSGLEVFSLSHPEGYNGECRQADQPDARPIEPIFFFSSHFRTIASSSLRPLTVPTPVDPKGVLAAVEDALAGQSARRAPKIVVGALPFSDRSGAALFMPNSIVERPPPRTSRRAGARPKATRIAAVPGPHGYIRGVEAALARLSRGELQKVVLARALDIDLDRQLDLESLLSTMVARNPDGFIYSVPTRDDPSEEWRLFLGASPELMVRREGSRFVTNPLAGSIRRGATPEEDRRNAEALLASRKDLHEHQLVVAEVERVLRPLCRNLRVPSAPSLVRTPTVWHLSTRITGELVDPSITSLALALALHPTPAVCGYPTDEALHAIASIETFDRRLYAGLVGWCDARGDGEWALAIRCAEVGNRSLRLFAGAGIVEGTRPEAELAETTAKLETMLSVIGVDDAAVAHAAQTKEVS